MSEQSCEQCRKTCAAAMRCPECRRTCNDEASVAYIASGAVFLFIFCFAFGWGPVVWVYCAEIFPLKYRSQLEALQIQRYQLGEFYQPHFDYIHKFGGAGQKNFRFATLLMYLSNLGDAEGGSTVFPYVTTRAGEAGVTYGASSLAASACRWVSCDKEELRAHHQMPQCCCGEALKINPSAGSAILFFPQLANRSHDRHAWHGGCPVLQQGAEKWTAQQWISTADIAEVLDTSWSRIPLSDEL